MSKVYVQQDGGDFYVYHDAKCQQLMETWSVHFAVGLSLEKALVARRCFIREHPTWEIEWPNPFA